MSAIALILRRAAKRFEGMCDHVACRSLSQTQTNPRSGCIDSRGQQDVGKSPSAVTQVVDKFAERVDRSRPLSIEILYGLEDCEMRPHRGAEFGDGPLVK